jgi:hypothetical protein
MFCTKCGKEYKDGQLFCTGCGAKLGDVPIAPTPQQSAPIPQQPTPASQQPAPHKKKLPFIIGGIIVVVILIACGIGAAVLFHNSDSRTAEAETESEETETTAGDLALEDTQETETDAETETAEEDTEDTEDEGETEAAVTEAPEEQEPFESMYLNWQETYTCDIDSDGTPEEIYCEIYTDYEDYYGSNIIVYVNGEKVIDCFNEYATYGSVRLCDFESQDPYREIYLEMNSDSDCFEQAAAYRYDKGRVTEYYNVTTADVTATRWSLDLNQSGDGTVCYDEEYEGLYLGMGYVYHYFTVENGKLVSIPTDVYETTDSWKESGYYALTSLTLLSDIDGDATGDVVEAGEYFYVQQLYTPLGDGMLRTYWNGDTNEERITYIYVITESGKSGWVLIPDEYFYETEQGSGYIYAWG